MNKLHWNVYAIQWKAVQNRTYSESKDHALANAKRAFRPSELKINECQVYSIRQEDNLLADKVRAAVKLFVNER